jgi:hypothetical protein
MIIARSSPSDASIRRSRSSLYHADDRDSMDEFHADKRRTYLVRYDENDPFGNETQNDDQPNFSTAV